MKNVLIKDDRIGKGELGKKLIVGFLGAMSEAANKPKAIFLLNRGVFLSTKNADSIAALKALENLGVEIYSCQTCLEHFNLLNEIKVGKPGNAKATLSALLGEDGAVSL